MEEIALSLSGATSAPLGWVGVFGSLSLYLYISHESITSDITLAFTKSNIVYISFDALVFFIRKIVFFTKK